MESQTTGKTTTEQQNEIVEFLKNEMNVSDEKIKQWFDDPAKRSILNALSTL